MVEGCFFTTLKLNLFHFKLTRTIPKCFYHSFFEQKRFPSDLSFHRLCNESK